MNRCTSPVFVAVRVCRLFVERYGITCRTRRSVRWCAGTDRSRSLQRGSERTVLISKIQIACGSSKSPRGDNGVAAIDNTTKLAPRKRW